MAAALLLFAKAFEETEHRIVGRHLGHAGRAGHLLLIVLAGNALDLNRDHCGFHMIDDIGERSRRIKPRRRLRCRNRFSMGGKVRRTTGGAQRQRSDRAHQCKTRHAGAALSRCGRTKIENWHCMNSICCGGAGRTPPPANQDGDAPVADQFPGDETFVRDGLTRAIKPENIRKAVSGRPQTLANP